MATGRDWLNADAVERAWLTAVTDRAIDLASKRDERHASLVGQAVSRIFR